MLKLIPAVLTSDVNEAVQIIESVEPFVDRVQVDVVDGVFAENRTIDPDNLIDLETRLAIDYHLMVKEPIKWVEKSVRGLADRIIGHVEQMSNQLEFLDKVQSLGIQGGLAIDLKTPVESLSEDALKELDIVLVMSVPAGFDGQEFDRSAISKIKRLDQIRKDLRLSYCIQVDGGVTPRDVDGVSSAGANEIVIGKRILKGDLEKNLQEYKAKVNQE